MSPLRVTLLAGDNGTGKSTVVELVAEAMGFVREGGELERLGELPAVPRGVLCGALEPVLARSKRAADTTCAPPGRIALLRHAPRRRKLRTRGR